MEETQDEQEQKLKENSTEKQRLNTEINQNEKMKARMKNQSVKSRRFTHKNREIDQKEDQ